MECCRQRWTKFFPDRLYSENVTKMRSRKRNRATLRKLDPTLSSWWYWLNWSFVDHYIMVVSMLPDPANDRSNHKRKWYHALEERKNGAWKDSMMIDSDSWKECCLEWSITRLMLILSITKVLSEFHLRENSKPQHHVVLLWNDFGKRRLPANRSRKCEKADFQITRHPWKPKENAWLRRGEMTGNSSERLFRLGLDPGPVWYDQVWEIQKLVSWLQG